MPQRSRSESRREKYSSATALAARTRSEPERRSLDIGWWLVVLAILIVPLVIFPGESSFRVIKQAAFIGLNVAIMAVAVLQFTWRRNLGVSLLPRRRPTVLVALVVAWSALVTLTSTNRSISIESLVWIVSGATYLTAVYVGARTRNFSVVLLPLIAAIANAVVLFLQVGELWNPIHFPPTIEEFITATGSSKLRHTALIGNPNDVGAYFIAPALGSVAAVIVTTGGIRVLTALAAVICGLAVLGSESLTAIAALSVGATAMLFLVSWRRAAFAAAVGAVVLIGAFVTYQPLRDRLQVIWAAAAERDFDRLSSFRLVNYSAALDMWRARPIFGVGPGCFRFNSFDRLVKADRKRTDRLNVSMITNEYVHNDHLQVLAQSGAPGYALFLAALVALGSMSFGRAPATEIRERYAAVLALPLAAAFAVGAFAGFPLGLAAATCIFLYYAGVCAAWHERVE